MDATVQSPAGFQEAAMKILVTGFDPFGGESINPAYEAVRRLPGVLDGLEIVRLEVPTIFNISVQQVVERIDALQPEAWLGVGQAGGRCDIGVERVAINLIDGRIADNAGYQPIEEPSDPAGAVAFFATLPVKAMVAEIHRAGIPASISHSAGTFVCNHLMYGVLHHIQRQRLAVRGGFIHIPYLPQQVVDKPNTPSMALETSICALIAALRAIVESAKNPPEL
jgi:pyroglutamyl-peptidase